MHGLRLVILSLLIACGSKREAPAPTAAAAPVAAPTAAPAVRDDRCADPCRFLATTPLAAMTDTVRASCGSEWTEPSSDQRDYLRNCIYAEQGYPFTKQRWIREFGGKPWYTKRAAFRDSDLSAIATANVQQLKQRATTRLAISAADQRVVDAWLASVAAGTPNVPAVKSATSETVASVIALLRQDDAQAHYTRAHLVGATSRTDHPLANALGLDRVLTLSFDVPRPPCSDETEDCEGFWGDIELALDRSGRVGGVHVWVSG